jgi:hypothetical protein
MLKNILKLDSAQKLTKNEQKSIRGGYRCTQDSDCELKFSQYGAICVMGSCYTGKNGL